MLKAIMADLGFNLEKFLFDIKLNRENLSLDSIFILGNILNSNDFIVREPKRIVSYSSQLKKGKSKVDILFLEKTLIKFGNLITTMLIQ